MLCKLMADYRIVLAQLPTPRAAEQAAQTLAAAFERHVDAIRKTRRYRGELTEPLHELARDEGFAWDAEDRFAWDDSDGDPNFVIGSAGHGWALHARGARAGPGDRAAAARRAARGRRAGDAPSALGTMFTGATLVGADFTSADLRGASFRDADVHNATWTGAELDGADFTGVRR
jgi:hypothetical protein